VADTAVRNPPGAAPVVYKPRHPAGLAQALVIALCVHLAADGLSLVADALVLLGASVTIAAPLELFQGLTGLLQTLVFLVAGFLSLKWVYRVSLNAHALASDMTITPAWGVGWFFVPIACLWKPYQGLRESWQVSASGGSGWQSQPVPLLLRWWWLAWIVANIVGNVSLRLEMGGQELAATGFALAQDLLNIPLDLLFILVVRRLTALQLGALSGRVFE
jgi:hypothetical protein